jgi:hypothetical protein
MLVSNLRHSPRLCSPRAATADVCAAARMLFVSTVRRSLAARKKEFSFGKVLYLLALDVSGRPRCLTYITGRASGSKAGSGPYPFLFHAYRRRWGEAFPTDEKFHFTI